MIAVRLTNISLRDNCRIRHNQNHTITLYKSYNDISAETTEADVIKIIKDKYYNTVTLNSRSKIKIISNIYVKPKTLQEKRNLKFKKI